MIQKSKEDMNVHEMVVLGFEHREANFPTEGLKRFPRIRIRSAMKKPLVRTTGPCTTTNSPLRPEADLYCKVEVFWAAKL